MHQHEIEANMRHLPPLEQAAKRQELEARWQALQAQRPDTVANPPPARVAPAMLKKPRAGIMSRLKPEKKTT